MKNRKTLWTALSTIIVIAVVFGIYQVHNLSIAHGTFENYYRFRGCVQLIEKTDTSGTCKLSSGQTIKIVEIQNKWYLDGDGPGVF